MKQNIVAVEICKRETPGVVPQDVRSAAETLAVRPQSAVVPLPQPVGGAVRLQCRRQVEPDVHEQPALQRGPAARVQGCLRLRQLLVRTRTQEPAPPAQGLQRLRHGENGHC